MRIWLQKHAVEGRSPLLDKMYAEHVATIAPHATVEIHTLPPQTYGADLPEHLVRYPEIRQLFGDFFADSAVAAERDDCDAWITAAGQDPGLLTARERVSIPVVGYSQVVGWLAGREEEDLGLVGFIPELQEAICANLRAAGAHVAAYHVIDNGPDIIKRALAEDFDPFRAAYAAAAVRVAAAGAGWVVPAEGIANELLVHLGIHNLADFELAHMQAEIDANPMLAGLDADELTLWLSEHHVIDPGGLAIATAEHLCRVRALPIAARPSRRRAPLAVVEHIERATRHASPHRTTGVPKPEGEAHEH
ncbi:hypothetical protein ACWDRB_66535 [Nonomuraea sp. NPDC003707]